jgi:hypothetical protein
MLTSPKGVGPSAGLAAVWVAQESSQSTDVNTEDRRESAARQPRVLLTVRLPRTGCAAVNPAETVYVSALPANVYPGDGPEPTRHETRSDRLAMRLEPGYYKIMYSSVHCWENFYHVVLLPGHSREITVSFRPTASTRGVDYLFWYAPIGAVAGALPAGITSVTLAAASTKGRRKPMKAVLRSGAYYFDTVPAGKYHLQYCNDRAEASKTVTIHKDAALLLNLAC